MQSPATTLCHKQEFAPSNSRNKCPDAALIGAGCVFFNCYIDADEDVIVFPHFVLPIPHPVRKCFPLTCRRTIFAENICIFP